MSKYETVVVFDGSLPEETIAKEQQGVEELIKANGSLVNIDVWGKKPLAYEINKKKTGFYSLFTYEFAGDANELVAGAVRYNENVIRQMTILHSDAVIVKKVEEEATAATEGEE